MRLLGKRPARHDQRTLRLAKYLTGALPPAPLSVDWGARMGHLGIMLNDQLGDCTCATAGHMIQCWTAANGAEFVPSDAEILTAYRESCGYDPADPSTDRGGVVLDVLNYWRQVGVGGHKILAYAAVDPSNRDHVRQAIHLFGGLYLGVALPQTAQEETRWQVALAGAGALPGSWGGHAINLVAYGPSGVTCVTWGERLEMSWDFLAGYCDEAYAVLSADWADKDGAPVGLDLGQLRDDLAMVAS